MSLSWLRYAGTARRYAALIALATLCANAISLPFVPLIWLGTLSATCGGTPLPRHQHRRGAPENCVS